jgi:hypothetical protein
LILAKETNMRKTDEPFADPVGAMLSANGQERVDNDPLRESVLARTVGVIRFRRRLKRCTLAAALAGCYLAGAVTMGIWGPARDNPSQLSTEHVAKDEGPQPAGNTERQVAAVKMSRFEMLRRAADRSLLEQGDLPAAIRDYRRAINLASAEQRAIAPGQDTWLFMALKDARIKEQIHVRTEPN